MNSRWQANKIGLINFWYYEEQEFPFVKGRMLLRGSNGSGKSVTMQSVVPLLLDGNMSPERLDPFGSRDRKMNSYLLEEDDERQERTGYLYLEFKRIESDTYMTIGMGIRARKGKPLDKWYFSLTDGRRIGKDFYLYKETSQKVTLSKKELEYRVGQGGVVLDRQADYMAYVNRQIFGFETADEYKELVDLLIQLRTPKLSKDFKPSVINDILSDSLQPLSDEELRPMSEAIENMDNMTMNLKSREESRQAAEKIARILDKYNKKILYEKAKNLDESIKNVELLHKEVRQYGEEMDTCRALETELEQKQQELGIKKEAMEKERDSLNKSDAFQLKEREVELSAQIDARKIQLDEKQGQLNAKEDQYRQCRIRITQEQDREYEKSTEITGLLEEMQTEAQTMSFEEHGFFEEEFKGAMMKDFSFNAHQAQMERTEKAISEGLELLRQADRQQRQADELLRKKDRLQREADLAARRVLERENMLVQVENEWKEALFAWNGRNTALTIPKEQLMELARFSDDYGEASDFSRVRGKVADLWIEKKGADLTALHVYEEKLASLRQEYDRIASELESWKNHREPEPERSPQVIENRRRLKEKNIPYKEFYKYLEFGSSLDKVQCGRLEEALMHMGILDALVVDEQFKDQVLALDKGCCDRYLFAGGHGCGRSLLDVLEMNDLVDNLFIHQQIINILQSISFGEEDAVICAGADGIYRMGPVTGTVTGCHEAGFLGTRAREENRQAKIRQCTAAMEELSDETKQMEEQCETLKSHILRLEQEYGQLPDDRDLRVAWNMLCEARHMADRLEKETKSVEDELRTVTESLRALREEALAIAGKLYLSCSLDVFIQAREAAADYVRHFYQLKTLHDLYLQIIRHLEELNERQKDLDEDLDQIRYDMQVLTRAQRRDDSERSSIVERLALTDYEQIKNRLDDCVRWLKDYPEQLRQCVEEKTRCIERIRLLQEKSDSMAQTIQAEEKKQIYVKSCYDAEAALGYVDLGDISSEQPRMLRRQLEDKYESLPMEDIIRDLNRIYFENRGYLNEYQLMQTELFSQLENERMRGWPEAKRMDIAARYQGQKVSFAALVTLLTQEIEDLQELIKNGDRELFEDILSNIISRKIRGKINASNAWVEKMNSLMGAMDTSSGLKLSLKWHSKTAESEDQLDTRELVDLLKKDYRLMGEDEAQRLSAHFRSKVAQARRNARDGGGMISFYQVMKETLDYRKWFEFRLFASKSGQKVRELTNSVFGTFSGGEKAMAMYVPLFSAVVAKYQGGREDAPRLISLDEAFAGVDKRNIRDMFRLMTEFQFDFIINSQVLWGDCDTLDALAIYQLVRPENAKFVTVISYLWNGRMRELVSDEQEMEASATGLVNV